MTNTSGIEPLDLRVLIRPDATADKVGSIFLPEAERDKRKWAQAKGTIIAIGENAWEEAAARSASFTRPVVGDRVMFGKYAGIEVKGDDQEDYRLMNDNDVVGRLSEKA